MNKFILVTLLITSHAYAQNIAVETYCFNSSATALKAESSAKYLMLPSDRIENKGNCFSLFANETRRELIQKYLLNSYPDMTVSYSSMEQTSKDMCSLKVEKIKSINMLRTKAQISALGGASTSQTTSNATETSQMKAMSGAPFELQVDTQKIEGKCRYINSTKYEIEFSMKFIPRPIIPPAPEGTIVVLNNPPAIETQQGTSLSTTLQINQGDRIEIGNIVKSLNEKAQSASLTPQVSFEKTEGKSQEKIFLMID